MKRKAQPTAEFRPPQRAVRVRRPQRVQHTTLGETSEPACMDSDQMADALNAVSEPLLDTAVEDQEERDRLQHLQSDKEECVSADMRSVSETMESDPVQILPAENVITAEIEEPDGNTKWTGQDELGLDLEPPTFTELRVAEQVDAKTNSSPEAQTGTSSHAVSRDVYCVEQQADSCPEKTSGGAAEAVHKTPDDNADTEMVKPPPRKRLRRRMGMCGLGDRTRHLPCGGQNSRQVPAGKQNEEGNLEEDIGTACEDPEGAPEGPACTDLSERMRGGDIGVELMGGQGATGPKPRDHTERFRSFAFWMNFGHSVTDHEGATCMENRDRLRSKAFEKDCETSVMDEEPSCKATKERLRSGEQKKGKEFEENGGAELMHDEGPIGPGSTDTNERWRSGTFEKKFGSLVINAIRPFCKGNEGRLRSKSLEKNIGSSEIDITEGTGPKSRESMERLGSFALEKNFGAAPMDDGRATGPEFGENKERLRSDTSEENVGISLMEDKGVTGSACREKGEGLMSSSSEKKTDPPHINTDGATRPKSRDREEQCEERLRSFAMEKNFGTSTMDDEEAPGPESEGNKERFRSDTSQKDFGTPVMGEEPAVRPFCQGNEKILRSRTFEKDFGASTMEDKGAAGPEFEDTEKRLRCDTEEKRIDRSEIDTEGATGPDCRDREERLRSGTSVMENKAGSSHSQNMERLRSDNSEDKTVPKVLGNEGAAGTESRDTLLEDEVTAGPAYGKNGESPRNSISEKNIGTNLGDNEEPDCTENANVLRNILTEENSGCALMADGEAVGEPLTEHGAAAKGHSLEEFNGVALMDMEENRVQNQTPRELDGPALMVDGGIPGPTKNSDLESNDAVMGGMGKTYQANVLMVTSEEEDEASACKENREELRDPIVKENDDSALRTDEGTVAGLCKRDDLEENNGSLLMGGDGTEDDRDAPEADNRSAAKEDEETTKRVILELCQTEEAPMGPTNGHDEVQDGQMEAGDDEPHLTEMNHPNLKQPSEPSKANGNGPDSLLPNLMELKQTFPHDGAEPQGDSNPARAPPAGLRIHLQDPCGSLVTPAVAEQQVSVPPVTPGPPGEPEPRVPLSLNAVTDSQLHSIALSVQLEDRPVPEGSDQHEDATELVSGLIRELSSMNRTVMAAHREIEALRRGNRVPKVHVRRSAGPRHAEI